MKIIHATLFLGCSKIKTSVRDSDQKSHVVEVTWLSKSESKDIPPESWADSAFYEVEHQRSSAASPKTLR